MGEKKLPFIFHTKGMKQGLLVNVWKAVILGSHGRGWGKAQLALSALIRLR